ncbi:MAG: DJ-1/PfpI family protein [Xanthomonadales bacterium]|nr:DJ-1/PfpI family protein [Xanthomonadales bacterium]
MQRILSRVFIGVLTLAASASALAIPPETPDRILIVISGEGRDQGKTRPGYEMDELSQAWAIFRDNGFDVHIASPKGGPVEADKYDPAYPSNARLLADREAMAQLAATRATTALKAEDYAAVFVVGGKGAMFDLPKDKALTKLIGRIHDHGGVVSAVCHGPAALVDVRKADGTLLVANRAVNGFSNEEETIFGKKWAKEYPFRIEDAMRARGARWEEAPLMMPRVTIDARLITGQNPYSTSGVAEAVVRATGRTPVARTPDRDERSILLVERLLHGDAEGARNALAATPAEFHVELIGLLGYYQAKVATTDAAVRDALAVMRLAQPHFPSPELSLGMAEAHLHLGERTQARALAEGVLAAKPDMEEAKALLARIHP